MANDREYATYSETGETFKGEDRQVPSPSLEKAGGRGGHAGAGGSKPPPPRSPGCRGGAGAPGPQGPGFVRRSCAGHQAPERGSSAGAAEPLCRATARSASRAPCLCENSVDYNENTKKPSYCRAVMVLLRLCSCRALPKSKARTGEARKIASSLI